MIKGWDRDTQIAGHIVGRDWFASCLDTLWVAFALATEHFPREGLGARKFNPRFEKECRPTRAVLATRSWLASPDQGSRPHARRATHLCLFFRGSSAAKPGPYRRAIFARRLARTGIYFDPMQSTSPIVKKPSAETRSGAAIEPSVKPERSRVALCLVSLYLIWGSTFLCIRIALQTFPPLLMAGLRFVAAGSILFAVLRARGHASPTP